jgi:putative transposase
VEWHDIAPGKPLRTGLAESHDGKLRGGCLDEHLFRRLRHAGRLIEARREDDNHHRPHSRLDGLTPREYGNRSERRQTWNRPNPEQGQTGEQVIR